MQYKLVPMDKSHLSQVAAIERMCFSHPWSEALLEQELYNDMISLVVAEGEDGTVLGYLEVRESNAPAIGLYEKLGFQVVGRRKNYYRELHEDALLMTITFSEETKGTE